MPNNILVKKNAPASRHILSIAIAVSIASGTVWQVNAAGFQLNAQSGTGLGRAFAGDAIIADNASVMAKNAAAMSLFDAPELSFGGIYIDTNVDVIDATYTPIVGDSVDASIDDIGGSSFIPNFYYIHPLTDSRWTVGVSVYSNFATDVSFPDEYVASEFGGETQLTSVNLGLSASYRINEQWSIGGGIDLIHGSGVIKREGLLNVDAQGEALGFNVGVAYELDANNRFGLSYRYSPELQAEGDVSMVGMTADSINIPLPDIIEFSGYHRLTNRFAVHYSAQLVEWSSFDALTADGFETSIKEYQWGDAGHLSIGGTYYATEQWQFRAGYMYDKAPTQELTSLSIPDSNRHWFTLGAGYQVDKNTTIDVGASYILADDAHIHESLTTIPGTESSISATTNVDAISFGVQYSYRF